MGLILPPVVQYNLARERLVERHEALRWFDRQLKELDPDLELVRAKEVVDEPGLRPGFWHVKRNNRDTVDRYFVIQGPDGEYMEPHSGFIEYLRSQDLQAPGAWKRLMENQEREERLAERSKVLAREERLQEFADRVKSYESPAVSMAGSWSYKTSGRRGRRKHGA